MDIRACKASLVCAVFVFLVLPTETRLVKLGKYKAGIARIHNYYRHLEKASNMQLMVWDNRLARRAAQWSENCYWGHQKKGLGENLSYYWSSGTLKQSDVIIKSIKGWYNEKYQWRWSKQCGAACHYTQVVWAGTSKVGCAYSVCSYLKTTGTPVKNAHYFVCFYDPPGNYYGQYPYRYGKQCSKCKTNDVCRDGLCCPRSRATHNIYLPFGNTDEQEDD